MCQHSCRLQGGKYTKTFRNSVLRKVLPPENRSISSVAKETGIAAVTISSWLAKVRNGTLNLESDEDGPSSERNMKEKLNLLLEYQKVTNENEGEWLRQNGLHSEHLTLFKQELSDIVTDKNRCKRPKNQRIGKTAVPLGIVRLSAISDFFGISERTIQRWNKNGTKDLRKGAEKSVPGKLTEEETGKIYEVCCS